MIVGMSYAFVIDDSQYLMCFEAFAKAKETGYGKYTDMALHFYNLVQFVIQQLPPDVIVSFLQHTDQDGNTGKIRAKTLGKMLDNQLTVEVLDRWETARFSNAVRRPDNLQISHGNVPCRDRQRPENGRSNNP